MGRKLFVGNLSFETTDESLKEAFSQAGTCESATVIKDRMTGRSRGFGFVEMASDEEAQRAVSTLNSALLQGRNINVREAQDRPAGRGPRPGGPRNFGPPAGGQPGPRFRREGGSRRGLRARKRSL